MKQENKYNDVQRPCKAKTQSMICFVFKESFFQAGTVFGIKHHNGRKVANLYMIASEQMKAKAYAMQLIT